MVESEAEFLMEVTDKTKADVKVRDLHLSDAKKLTETVIR